MINQRILAHTNEPQMGVAIAKKPGKTKGVSPVTVMMLVLPVAVLTNIVFTASLFLHEASRGPAMDPRTSIVGLRRIEKREPSLLSPSVWSTRRTRHLEGVEISNITALLTSNETERALSLCGKFFSSTLRRATHVKSNGLDTFVATGDIDSMWIRDSVVQMTLYLKYITELPWLRPVVDGAIRRNAFNILQDPYGNAYEHQWKDARKMELADQVIGRGGFVSTRNYELDSGAYFLLHLYDYYMTENIYNPETVLQEPNVFEAVMALVNMWILEQNHDTESIYRYFELQRDGKGTPSGYTGMTWTGFRPSDDACEYGYHVPANIHAAAALERTLILNDRVWKNKMLGQKVSKLLKDMTDGINKYGIVRNDEGKQVYAYEVDGLGRALLNFDDANVPSLLSIPLLGWSGFDEKVYQNTRKDILSKKNKWYFEGEKFRGVGSPHTNPSYVWPMSFVIQGLTETGPDQNQQMAFQMRQLLSSASGDAMHESVYKEDAERYSRYWFEWTNALFVMYVEATMGLSCAPAAIEIHRASSMGSAMKRDEKLRKNDRAGSYSSFHKNEFQNTADNKLYYQDLASAIQYE